MEKIYKYDVAISFAEEDRNAALLVALALEISGGLRRYIITRIHKAKIQDKI
jgi:hypothetical protein